MVYETIEPPLLYPRVEWLRRRDLNPHRLVYKTSALHSFELRRIKDFGGLEESRTLTSSLQDYDAACYITSPKWKMVAEARIELAPSGL